MLASLSLSRARVGESSALLYSIEVVYTLAGDAR